MPTLTAYITKPSSRLKKGFPQGFLLLQEPSSLPSPPAAPYTAAEWNPKEKFLCRERRMKSALLLTSSGLSPLVPAPVTFEDDVPSPPCSRSALTWQFFQSCWATTLYFFDGEETVFLRHQSSSQLKKVQPGLAVLSTVDKTSGMWLFRLSLTACQNPPTEKRED